MRILLTVQKKQSIVTNEYHFVWQIEKSSREKDVDIALYLKLKPVNEQLVWDHINIKQLTEEQEGLVSN